MNASLFDLSGKVAVVTGTSRGLGQYLGRALARAGADLVITSRDPKALRSFQEEIEQLGRKALPLELDVTINGATAALTPFLEGMLVAAWCAGVGEIYIYLRDEYAGCRKILEDEIR